MVLPFGPSFPFFPTFFFSRFLFFLAFYFFIFSHFLFIPSFVDFLMFFTFFFHFFRRKKFLLFFFLAFLSNMFCFQAFVSEFNCFLRCRCSMEMWCPHDIGRDSWDWVGPPAWGRACFNSPEWGGGSSPVKTEPHQIVLLLLLLLLLFRSVHSSVCMSTTRTYATTVTETNLHGLTTCVMSPYSRLQADKAACHPPPSAAGPPPDDYRHGTVPRAAPDRGV